MLHSANVKQSERSGEEIFADLEKLCCQPGYIHAMSVLCFKHNEFIYEGEIKESDIGKISSPSRLIRPETNMLIGLMIKSKIDWILPSPEIVRDYVYATEQLLEELHYSSYFGMDMTKEELENSNSNVFQREELLREPIFYSTEGAYGFQYLDLAVRKYAPDNNWIKKNRCFTIDQATRVVKALQDIREQRFNLMHGTMEHYFDQSTMIDFFTFTDDEVSINADLDIDVVKQVLGAFELPTTERNENFNSPIDFNIIVAKPIIRMSNDERLLLQPYSLAEAIYEQPYYWMIKDKEYKPTHDENRGEFVENFVTDRLELVFGNDHVYRNVDLFRTKAEKISEIDVLVIWGDRMLIVQTKSKRLTLESRKGTDENIRNDFEKAVQEAYKQGVLCAKSLVEKSYCKVSDKDRCNVKIPNSINEIYIFCIVGDHYPALNLHTIMFLETELTDQIQAPLVMDIFTLDAITEMLQSPLKFLSYINRRIKYIRRIIAHHELVVLGYHLKTNLSMPSDNSLIILENDFTDGLDVAMEVRRTGAVGASMPDGAISRFDKTSVGHIVRIIENRPDPEIVDLGFLLLSISEEMINEISHKINQLIEMTCAYGKVHDFTEFLGDGEIGITFHCNDELLEVAISRLKNHCIQRKHKQKADKWFGLCMSSTGSGIRFGVSLVFPWIQGEDIGESARKIKEWIPNNQSDKFLVSGRKFTKKISRNDPCPCGSGLKYKKCCLSQSNFRSC